MRFAVKTKHGCLIALNGERLKPEFFGPFGRKLKVWKRRQAAEKVASKYDGEVLVIRPDGTLVGE